MAFKDKLKDIFKPNWEAEPKNTSGASAGNSPTVQPAAATSSSDWNFDSLFTKPDGTPSSGTASGFKSLDSIFQPKDQAEIPEWKPEFDSQGFYKPTGKLSSRAYQRDIAAGNNYDAMGQNDKTFFSTYYQTLDNHTKLYTDLEDLTWGNTAENGKAFKSQYANGLKSLRDELDEVGRQYGINSNEYRALAQFKDDYFNLGRQISANYVDKDRRAASQNLDDTIDTVLSGVVQAPDYQEKVEAGRKAIESNPTVYHRYKLGLEGASDKQRDLMYYIYANEGDKGAREFFDRVMGDTINYQKAAKDFTKDITTNDTKAARFWEANKANFAAAIDGQFGTGVRQLFTNTKADPDNRTIIKGYEISDSVDDFLRQQIALDEEELAIYGDDAFARLSSEVSADWVKEAAKDASDYQKGVLGYLYLAYKNPEASEALWEEIKGLDDEIWQMVNPGTVATAASSIEGSLYRDYLGLGSNKAPSWMGNPGEGEDKEDLAVAQAIWDFALTTRAQYPQMAGNILGALAGGPLVGQVLGSAIMSTSVYGNSYKESIEQGYSPKQAAAYGVSQAMSEFGTDMLLSGIAPYAGALTGNVGRTIVRRISNPFLQAVANLGIRSMGEGLQEYVQDIIDVPIRNIIFQENNKLNLADPGAVYSFFLGAMSAAAMSAPNISSEINVNKLHVQFGRALTKLDSTQKLVDTIVNSKPAEGLTKEQRESYDKAVSIAKDLKAGRVNPNNRLVGEMFANAGEGKIDLSWLENPATIDYNKDALTVEDMAAGARARLAELHGNVDLAQDLARYAAGEQVTAEFMQTLKDDAVAAQVFSELTGELDMENDKNALTIAARSTTRNNTGNKDYDTLKAENTTQTVASPAATTLFKAGIEFEEAQQIGAVIEKVANGQTITEDEAELIPVSNSAMRQILSDTLGITIAEDATIGTVLQEMNNAAATMAETRSMQQEVANTAKQAAQARMPIPPNQQVDTTGTISIAGVEMNHDQFIENFMQKPGATLEQAEKAWANGRTVSAALNGEESTNGRRSPIPSNPERRNESVAAGGTVQEGTERGAETGRPVDTGTGREGGESQATGEELKRQLGYDPKNRVKRFNAEQRKFLLFCRDLGFNSIVLVKGKLNNEDGAPINAKFDPRTKQLTIRWDNPFKDINSVAMHEAIHLWLTEAFGESAARYEYVNNALKDIFGEDTAAYEEMVKKYVEAYKIAYSGLDETTFLNYINEEILADMYGGMENYGAKAGQYQQQAEMYVTQTNLRGEETETEPSERLSLDDPFRNDVDLSIPAEVRPYPGEPDAHPDLSMFSLTGMAEGGNFELQLNTAGQPYALVDKRTGKRVEHVTSEMMVDTPLGNIVNMALEGGNITAAQAAQQYQMLADAMNLIVDYKDAALVWELVGSQMFSAVKANSDKQYNKTIDFSTICKKTMAIVDAMSETMKKMGRGLTRREVEIVYEETGKKGLATPCPVCYVFSRWMGIGGLLDQMKRFQKKYAGMSEEQIKKFMAKIEKDAHDFAKKNPKSTYWDEGGHFLIGKVLSDMKAGPNGEAARAIETLNAHQQAVNMIAELEKAKQGAPSAKVKEYDDLIKKLRYNVKKDPKKLAEAEAKMEAAEAKVEPFEEYQWLAKTMMISESSEINADGEAIGSWKLNPNFKPVPDDILFDLNKGGEFAHDYPLSWAFRTGKGCAAGKAIAPYSDARVGETIQGVALADVKDIRIGDTNEFKNGDINKQQQTLKSARKKQRRQNLIGGMRYQSTSDFRYEFGSDYLMTFLEMQAIGANVQLYTKVIEAVDFLASTGADCNLSVMPLGDGYVEVGKDANGDPIYELRYSSVTGINKDAAVKKSREYDNVQLILVGINDLNIKLALASTDVTFVIPFHGSGQSVHQVQTLMDLIGEQLDVTKAQDYTSVQTDRAIKNRETEHPELQAMWDLRLDIIKGTFLTQDQKDALKAWNEATTEEEKTAWANRLSELGKMKAGLSAEQKARLNQNKHLAKLYDLFYVDTTDPAFYNNLANDQAEQIFPYEYWDKSLDYDHADENGRIFQEYCASIGVIPRFSGINAKYEKTGFGDFTQDKGYWKLLIDRPMYKNVYDENGEWIGYGEYRAQQQINMTNIDIGDLNPETGKAQFQNGEMSKQYDATHNAEDLATRDNIVSDSIKRIEALRGSANVVDRNALDRTRVKKNFREKIMEAQSALREANQTEEQAAPRERLSLADLTNEENSGTIDTNQNQGSEANATEEDETRRRERRVHRLVKQLSSQNWTEAYFQGVRDQVEGLRPDRAWCTTEPKARRLTDVAAKFFLEEGHEFAGETLLQTNDAINYGVQDFLGWFFDTMYHTSPEEFTEMLMDKIEDADVLLRRMQKEMAVKNEAEFPENFAPTEADTRYMKAIKDGDVATLQDMVRDAAQRAGYNMELYQHSAGRRRFEAFDRGEFGFHLGSWAQAAHIVSQRRDRTYDPDIILPLYVSIHNPTAELTDLGDWQVNNVAGDLLYAVDEGWDDDLAPYRDELDSIASNYNYDTNRYKSPAREQLTDILDKAGHDAIAYENSYEDSEYQREGAESYIIWKPTQMKSADLITYDQDGKVIPLSQRFDRSKPEYRYSLALDDAGFETSNNEAPVTDERGQVLYVAPSSDAWAVARDTDGSLLNTEYIQNELGLPIYDNPHDEYVPEKRGAVIPKASDLKHKTANSSTEPSYVQAFDYLTRTGKQGARVLDASSGLGHGVEYGRSQGFDVTDLEPYSGGRPVDFRKYGGLIAAIESGQEEPFDFIISNAVINVMAQDAREELLANLIRMLRPGGELFINPADTGKPANPLTLEQFHAMKDAGEDVSNRNVILVAPGKGIGREVYVANKKTIQKAYGATEFKAFAKDVARQALGEDIKLVNGDSLPGLNKGFVITRSDEAQSGSRYSLSDEQQEKNVDYNNRQNTVGGQLKTRNGSTIKRGGTLNGVTYPIGKVIGDRLYIHKDYVDSAIQANPEFGEALEKAQKKLQDTYPGFEYNCLNYQPKTGQIQFQEAPDFDTAREPVVGQQVNVEANGDISKIKSFGQIWHHKWQWVGDGHPGFAESWNWSKQWLNALKEPSKGGSLAAWNKQLDEYGLPHDDQSLFSIADERYSVNKKNPFPEGSAEQQMLDILTNANKAEDLQEYINKLIEKRNESIARSNYTPPSLPQNTLFPVNAKQKQAGTNQLQKLIDKYGALKKGEKPARDKSYPERTSDSRFTQRTARTAAEAASIPEYFADQIDQAVLSELLTYARITDQAALKVGDGDYNRLGYKNAIKEWNETRANTNRPSKYDIAFGERILVEAARNNDAAVAMKVLADLAAMATQSGQVVQAIRMLKDMGPVGQLYYIQKAVDRINKDNAGRIAKGTFPPITIDQAKAEAVILSNTKKEMDENMKVLIQSIADQIPVSLKDKWDAWRYFAMLGNIRTHGRNVLGNAIFAPVRFAKDLLAAAGESAFIKDPNERTKNAAAALKSQKYQDLRAFALEDFENMQQYIITGSKMNPLNEIMEARKIFNKGVVGKNFEKLRRWNDNMLNKEDTIFLRKAYVSAFSQFVAARGLTAAQLNDPKGGAVINEARQYAALEAQKATYRDFSRLASALNHLRRNSGMGLLLDGLLPFTKTPINILRRGVEYSPVGLMKGTFDALVKVRRGDITAAQAIDEMAAGLTGTGVALLGYILASMGLARGADDDDDKKKAIEEAEGHQKYSLEIGGISYTIDWMAPVALPFFVGVEAHKQLVGDGEGTFWDFCDAMTLLCEPMMSLSMLDGINSTLSAVKSSQNNAIWAVISNILASYVSQGAPTIAGQVARTFDPDRRSTYIDKNIEGPALLQRTIQGIQGKTPWASKKMAYVDVWGRKDTNSSFLLRAAENLALPGYGNRINETPVDTELLRLYDAIGDNDVLPDTVAKYFQVEGERLNLTAKQYEQYKTVTGQTAFKMIGDLIDDPIYGKMDDTEKAAVVKSLLNAATDIGKKTVAPTYKMENWVDHAVAQDNLETAAIYRTLKAANTGLSNYQLISAMDWLTPEDRGKLIMEEHSNVDRVMTDPRRKKHKFTLTDEQIAREREIYNSLFWPAYNELIYSQKFMNADIANRANMISSMQKALGTQSRTQLSDELTAAGYTSAVQDDSDVPGQVTSLYDLLNRG